MTEHRPNGFTRTVLRIVSVAAAVMLVGGLTVEYLLGWMAKPVPFVIWVFLASLTVASQQRISRLLDRLIHRLRKYDDR